MKVPLPNNLNEKIKRLSEYWSDEANEELFNFMGWNKKNKYKVIFLDIDGVLNNTSILRNEGIDAISGELVNILKCIVVATKAEIVLSSTWRIKEEDRILVKNALAAKDLKFIDCTPLHVKDKKLTESVERWEEIAQWLSENPNVDKFAIIDDDEYAGIGFEDNFFKTDFKVGLTWDVAEKVMKHLGYENIFNRYERK